MKFNVEVTYLIEYQDNTTWNAFKFWNVSDDNVEPHIFVDDDISQIVDMALKSMDQNLDGLIEFPEFIFGGIKLQTGSQWLIKFSGYSIILNFVFDFIYKKYFM